MYNYSEKELEIMKKCGIHLSKCFPFVPGISCLGESPFGKSDACETICFGDQGIYGYHKIKPPCNLNSNGFLGSSIKKSLEESIAGI
ncbi:MAG: hypothetical protein A3E91_00410 [Candidatus Moranbacteria bacterium RIFCSPHIGHO2_12_FULL_40_10]|nr:MAG: hypothetical protein A3E91_00410 [Candidatus Moranbacteria bacterium RIFCSPHIGHO2_12_FULL_40_10]